MSTSLTSLSRRRVRRKACAFSFAIRKLRQHPALAGLLIASMFGFSQGAEIPAEPQAPPPLAFEAASVRQNKSGEARQESQVTPGRLTVRNMSLRNIIKNAYGFREDSRLQGPNWINSENFDITASAVGDADKSQIFLMLQSLLAERFKLEAHHELNDIPVYLLLQAKGGAKLRELKSYKPRESKPDTQFLVALGPPSGLTTRLAQLLGRPVLDKTGITGRYDFTLEIHYDDPSDHGDASLSAAVFGALQEQLGLKLEAGKEPIDILVIDHIERPSGN